jgi:hypothetical protein
MCAQPALKEEQLQSQQGDFQGLLLSTNGDGVRLFPGEEQFTSAVHGVSDIELIDAVSEQTTRSVVIEGALVISTRFVDVKIPMVSRAELSTDDTLTINFSDHLNVLTLQIVGDTGIMNINFQYTEKPLEAALSSARFFEALATTPGNLVFEAYEVGEEGKPIPHRIEVGELPLSVPETKLQEYRDRLRILEGFYDIFVNTGVEIRYPANTEDEESLDNLNFVLKAKLGGCVPLSTTCLNTHIPAADVRALLDEPRDEGEVRRAFIFELQNESYQLFGEEVALGPSSRYVAAARLATTQEEMEAWLQTGPENGDTLELKWEPIDDAPMHVFFDEWPKSSIQSVDRELREFEAIYGISSEHFEQGWREGASWARGVSDGKRWFSLILAREELVQGS